MNKVISPRQRVTLASDWLEGCAGCHMSLLDMDERIVELVQMGLVLTATPITDLKIPAFGTDLGVIEGAVATDHQLEVAKLYRERCKVLVALGDCAVFGGVNAMRNWIPIEELLLRGYVTTETTVDGKIPKGPGIGTHLPRCMALNEVVKVDFFIPGCPPSADAIYQVLKDVLEGKTPKLEGKLLSYE
jgi:NAD-reducing hydrogenase small subunit